MNNFLIVANSALNFIYSYNGYTRTWQHYSDSFVLQPNATVHKLITTEPVALPDKFRTTKYPGLQNALSPCMCEEQPEYTCTCECSCTTPCEFLRLNKILPNNNLCPGDYQIAGSEIKGMGGYTGRIVKINLVCKTDYLWFSYFKGVKHVTKFSDILPLPDSFIHIFGMICAALISPIYGAMMQQQDLNRWSIARKELDNMKAIDNIFPKKIEFDKTYPFEQIPHDSMLLFGKQVVN